MTIQETTEDLKARIEGLEHELDDAIVKLRRITRERDSLKFHLEEFSFEQRARELLELTNIGMKIVDPMSFNHLINNTLNTIAKVVDGEVSSLSLVDRKTNEMVLEIDRGMPGHKTFRFPLGEGFAGIVAATGEAMNAFDLEKDPRWKRDIAEKTGYFPKSLLCVPVVLKDEVIGVVEIFNKNGGEPFTIEDMNLVRGLTDSLAILVANMSIYQDLGTLFVTTLQKLAEDRQLELKGEDLTVKVAEFAKQLTNKMELSAAYQETLDIAILVHEIGEKGNHARSFLKTMLEKFLQYIQDAESEEKLWSF